MPYVLDCPAKDYLENAAQMIGISPEDMIVTDVPGEGVQAVYSKKLNTQAARQAELERLGSLDDFPTNTSGRSGCICIHLAVFGMCSCS